MKKKSQFTSMLEQAANKAAEKKPQTKNTSPQKTAATAKPKTTEPVIIHTATEPTTKNHERFTVSIYQNDIQAASVIREQLDAHGGINFPTRSMIVRIALRIASQSSPEQLLAVYQKVQEEDQRLGKNKLK